MTRCNKSEVNLKSTAYNQNGQNYYEQLTAYNSMSAHLRRILLAKCVVDARNRSYIRKKKQMCKQTDWKPQFVKTEITNNVIDKLTYDVSYHPMDFLRMNYDSKYFCQCEARKYFTNPLSDYNEICSRPKSHSHVVCPSSSIFKTDSSEPVTSNSKNIREQSYSQSSNSCRKIFNSTSVETALKFQDRIEKNSMYYKSTCDYLSQNINHLPSEDSTSRNHRNYETAQLCTDFIDQKAHIKDEEAKYAKFMYDITHEIILNGLYTDEELQEVFKKHTEENKTILDTKRMLYEIYQLKLALNISDNSEGEELEDLVYAQQLLNISEIRPLMPARGLNEDRVLKKLMWYQKLDEIRRDALSAKSKSVILIDANPELHITEKDVLTSLIEADINPEKARKICRKLFFKSKSLNQMIKPNNEYGMEESDQFDTNLTESYDLNKVDEQDKSSVTDDFVTEGHKDIQT
ncbi:uncharacterized protein LOC126871732 isoform X1 [Bombus huntii]|uniref:uncharacterized protein LOC126871732 isoform X1 n=2 Tax=Bombus huntii TaxID=85661 RepID=UPI0021A9AFDB|nr:uncharacterized protein LOC126871732 isoform X1 [Bombus huntii]